ncbi:hypothetical protein GCM10010317_049440 [Streptomyces mirabilis]|nr:hypothetical protein GCM10010317_049440 [Streptomyces mirabilis]
MFTAPPLGPRAEQAHGFPRSWAAGRGILARRRPHCAEPVGTGSGARVPNPVADLQGFTAGFEDTSTGGRSGPALPDTARHGTAPTVRPRHGVPGPCGFHPAGRRIPNS